MPRTLTPRSPAAHPRRRPRARPARRGRRALRPRQGQDRARRARPPAPRAQGRLVLVSAINPTPAGEGKTTTSIGARDGHAPPRQARRALPARAVARPGLRREGRRHRRRQGDARARRRHQPPLHRRHPRDHHRAQPARRRWSTTRATSATRSATRARSIRAQVTWGRALDMNDRFLRNVRRRPRRQGARRAARGRASTSPRRARSWRSSRSPTSYADLEARLGRIVVGCDARAATPVTRGRRRRRRAR